MPGRFEFERAIRRSDLPPLSRLLALTIATWANANTGIIAPEHQPSQSVLLQATGLAKGTFLTHRTTLVRVGWITYGGDGTISRRRGRGQNGYALHIPVGSGADLTGPHVGSGADPTDRSGADPPIGQELTTRVIPSPEKKSTGARGHPSGPSGPQGATARPSLRSGRLLSEPQADRHRPEDPLPVVRTATIPGDDHRDGRREESAGELQREREIHNQGCYRCQRGHGACETGAELIRQWMRALNREAG